MYLEAVLTHQKVYVLAVNYFEASVSICTCCKAVKNFLDRRLVGTNKEATKPRVPID